LAQSFEQIGVFGMAQSLSESTQIKSDAEVLAQSLKPSSTPHVFVHVCVVLKQEITFEGI
jgi:hypothetical protein